MPVDTSLDSLSYKFTKSNSVKSGAGLEPIKRASRVITHADLTAAATSEAIVVAAVPNKAIMVGVGRKLLEDFAGGTVSAAVIDVGDGTNVDRFIDNQDIFTGAANTFVLEDPLAFGDATAETFPLGLGAAGGLNLTATFTATGDNVVNFSAGAIRVTMWYILPEDEDA